MRRAPNHKPPPDPAAARHGVVIVDDHPLIREHLALVINGEPDLQVVGTAESRTEAIEVIERAQPALAIVDLSLRDSHGLELIKDLKARGCETRILVLSMQDEAIYAQRSLAAGALGYITKQRAPHDILSAIRRVLAGHKYLSAEMAADIAESVGNDTASRPAIHRLSDRELQVFEMIGRGFNSKRIADALGVSIKTVETYRERIKAKLEYPTYSIMVESAIHWFTGTK